MLHLGVPLCKVQQVPGMHPACAAAQEEEEGEPVTPPQVSGHMKCSAAVLETVPPYLTLERLLGVPHFAKTGCYPTYCAGPPTHTHTHAHTQAQRLAGELEAAQRGRAAAELHAAQLLQEAHRWAGWCVCV